jgi:hypothetical protein
MKWILLLYLLTIPKQTLQVESKIIGGVPNQVEVYRLTHYYTGDPYGSGTCTASGICTNRFQTNEKGWYTYKGKLVIATATNSYIKRSKYGFNENITYRNLFDEINIMINGIWYEAIILDVCGMSMKEPRIDLFVSAKEYGIDKEVYVK